MKFNQEYKKVMKESLLDGKADYSEVMDAITDLTQTLENFKHIYPMDRGSHGHIVYQQELKKMNARVQDWIKQQAKFVASKPQV